MVKARADETDPAGYELPVLLLGAFRAVIDELHAELARLGHPHARPVHGFALQALGTEGATITELGRRLGVTKQAAGKTATSLEQLGYVVRHQHPGDARASLVRRSDRGDDLLASSAQVLDVLRARAVRTLGATRVRALERDLAVIARPAGVTRLVDVSGWLR